MGKRKTGQMVDVVVAAGDVVADAAEMMRNDMRT